MLSHEIRNPLAVIMAGISLLDLTADAEKAKKCKRNHEEAVRTTMPAG